jgi:hypothetical protein
MRCFDNESPMKPSPHALPKFPANFTADKGYFAIEEIAQIQEFDIRTVIGDAHCARRRKLGRPRYEKLFIALLVPLRASAARDFCRSAGCIWNAASSTSLTKAEMRRATLQGKENLTKRHKIAAACFNLSLLLRTPARSGNSKTMDSRGLWLA